jgi:uncharacterized protein YjbJ (UPF0337 family)
MDKDRIVGSAKEIKGAAKDVVGTLIGDAKLQADGKSRQGRGQASKPCWRRQGRGARRPEEMIDRASAVETDDMNWKAPL